MELRDRYEGVGSASLERQMSRLPRIPRVASQLARERTEPGAGVREFSRRCLGFLEGHGFEEFRNGGACLYERRVRGWKTEIVCEPPSVVAPGLYVPVTFRLHVTNRTLAEMRRHYLADRGHPVETVCSRNLGAFRNRRPDRAPRWVVWNIGSEAEAEGAAAEVRARVADDVLPWLSVLEDGVRLGDRLAKADLVGLNPDVALELFAVAEVRHDPLEAARNIVERAGIAWEDVLRLLPEVRSVRGGPRWGGDCRWNVALVMDHMGLFAHHPTRIWA
ncbi:MAG: hypothetical protein SNJ74_05200 [Fimbriimonadaceae bacterium]